MRKNNLDMSCLRKQVSINIFNLSTCYLMDSRWSLPLWMPAFAGMTKGAGMTKHDIDMYKFV